MLVARIWLFNALDIVTEMLKAAGRIFSIHLSGSPTIGIYDVF